MRSRQTAFITTLRRRLPLPALPRPPQSLVSGPLVSVQASLMKDVAVWTRGLYSVPSLVPLALGQQLQLADRLSALQLVVRDTPPVVHGHLSGWVFATLVAPMHKEMTVRREGVHVLGARTPCFLADMHIPMLQPRAQSQS